MALISDDRSDEGDVEFASPRSCNDEESDNGSIPDIPTGCRGNGRSDFQEKPSRHTLTNTLPEFHDDGFMSAGKFARPATPKISTIGDLHVILQRERHRGSTVANQGISKYGNPKEAHISLSTASARASILNVSSPVSAMLSQRRPSQSRRPSHGAQIGRADEQNHDRTGAEVGQLKQELDSFGNLKGFRSLMDHSTSSGVKAHIHSSKDHQVEIFDRIYGSEDGGHQRQRKKAFNDRFRSKAAHKLRLSRQQAIRSRLSSDASAKAQTTDLGIATQRSNLYDSLASDTDDFLAASLQETIDDAVVNNGKSNGITSNTIQASRRTSRRTSSIHIQAQRRRSSFIGNVMLGCSRRNCEVAMNQALPTMAEIMKMVQEIPISKNKLKYVEIPRLRSRFHDREGKILNNMFEDLLSTTRRTNERVAESLGLKLHEWDWQHTYSVSVADLKAIADKKLARRRNGAVRIISAFWLKCLKRRKQSAEEVLRRKAAVKLQRWWRRQFAFVPIKRKARRRLQEKLAAIKIQALIRRFLLRNKLLLVIEMHHLTYSLSKLQHKLLENNKLLRWQSLARSLMLRQRLLGGVIERQAAVFAAFDGELASAADVDLAYSSEGHVEIDDEAFDAELVWDGNQRMPFATFSEDGWPGYAKSAEIGDDMESLPSTRAPSSRACNRSVLSRTPTRPVHSSRDSDMLTPTPPAGKPIAQRPQSSCSSRPRFARNPHRSKFHPIFGRLHYADWSPQGIEGQKAKRSPLMFKPGVAALG